MPTQKASDGEFYNGNRIAPSFRLMAGPVCLKSAYIYRLLSSDYSVQPRCKIQQFVNG